MATQVPTLPAASRAIDIRTAAVVRYLSLLAGLGLTLLVVQAYRLENRTFFTVASLTVVGFAIHALLPLAWRLPFFVALSFAGFAAAFSPADAAWLIGVGLALIGMCHLPIRFGWRVALVLATGTTLGLARAHIIPTPIGGGVWPILGAIFMFRLAVYLHAVKHGEVERSVARTLAYFFMLPNVSFALFPVVDYTTFRRNYYDDESWKIYETGLLWIVRGLVQLLLYRLVYLNYTLQVTEVHSLGDLLQFVLANFALYLRVSGQFHLIVGLLHLFGFRLPETHHLYYLSSSFTDFWRRINIYWKDFMMKLVYYPSFFWLRRLGNRRAIVLATAIVFVATWLLHSYQWFWLRGGFPITVPDTLFWGILGVLVVITSLKEIDRGRKRAVGKPGWSAALGLKTVGMFTLLTILWSLWSAESLVEWLWMWRAAGHASLAEVGVLVALLAAGFVATGRPWGAKTLAREEKPSLLRHPTTRAVATLAGLMVIAQPSIQRQLPATARPAVASLQNPGLNSVDAAQRVRGYYEQLDQRGAINAQALWDEVGQKPASWVELGPDNLIEARTDFLLTTLKPSYRFTWNGHLTSTNQWGMRDREYALAKPAGTYRIAILGPSLTMGNGVDDDQTFDNVLEARLAREPIGDRYQRVEVLNFGINGHALPQQLALLEDRVLRFQPDLVIMSESPYYRDMVARFLQRVVWEGYDIPYPELRTILAGGGLFPADTTGLPVPFATARRVAGIVGVDTRMTWEESRARIHSVSDDVARWSTMRMAAAIRAQGAVPATLAITPADPLPKDAGSWTRVGRDAGIVSFDLVHLFDDRDLATLRVSPWDNHPNALGHHLIADGLYRQLRDQAQAIGLRN